MSDFAGNKYFRIHRNDAGTEAYDDKYVKYLETEIERLREENARLHKKLADRRCAKCCGTGTLHRSWNDDYIDCDACDGRGH